MKINVSINTNNPSDLHEAQTLVTWLAEQQPAELEGDAEIAGLIAEARDRTAAKQRAAHVLSWAGGKRA